jgi:hypothetical protein
MAIVENRERIVVVLIIEVVVSAMVEVGGCVTVNCGCEVVVKLARRSASMARAS